MWPLRIIITIKKNTTAHKMKTKMALIMKILSQERENVIDV